MFMKAKEHSLRVDYFNNNKKHTEQNETTLLLLNIYNDPTANKPKSTKIHSDYLNGCAAIPAATQTHILPLKFKMRYIFCHIIIFVWFNLLSTWWNIADPIDDANGDDDGLLFSRKLLSITHPLWSNLLLLMSIRYWICKWETSLTVRQ